ncbi:MAG: hypothetical protein HRT88_02940 [Lentisphaeraceae bacterium]|nr:hypothetical protein [Lentisphaeraceae bacterium]
MTKRLTFFLLSAFLLTTSCIEVAVVGGTIAAGSFISKQGKLSVIPVRTKESSWEITSDYAGELGTVIYSSELEGKVVVEYTDGGKGVFTVASLTAKSSSVVLDSSKFGLPSNKLSEVYFPELAERLK